MFKNIVNYFFLNKDFLLGFLFGSITTLAIPFSVVGIPIIYFSSKGSLSSIVFIAVGFFLIIWLAYCLVTILLFPVLLKRKESSQDFKDLGDFEKGKYIAKYLSSW